MTGVFDQMAFRRALGQFPTGVCVMTTKVEGELLGMTMSSFNSLSLDPALVLFSIDKRARSLPQWEQARGYAIHVLSEGQQALSNRFAGRQGDKWAGLEFDTGLFDVPLLHGVAARFECAPHQIHEAGDHRLFIARVDRFTANPDRRPLLFTGGRYGAVQSNTEEAPIWPLAIHY
ncbi:flavin reductase family protein [Pseudodonghicola flavimaris]|uniref:Flavin reductase n=1 Tax=Pseudodonghicola flavimaris TaxID=3050036 RepID=A0ABT7F2N2_9RHOB|nr:flavin reductase [Pseudodonghicola flavimaris]MDK3018863.1 flavin reductase [Pseudodonghicola flavimaris]